MSGGDADADGDGRDETSTERADRNWSELLQELRVTQTGVQVLTGFLLTVPFQQRFQTLDRFQRGTYVTAVLLAVLTTMLTVAPVSWHRILFTHRRKQELVRTTNRFARAGLVCLVAAITAVVLLVIDVVSDRVGVALLTAALALIGFLVLWLALPLAALRRHVHDRPR